MEKTYEKGMAKPNKDNISNGVTLHLNVEMIKDVTHVLGMFHVFHG
jgi:hypothetical protein